MKPAQPNIVLIHVHDLGRWLSCYDKPSVPSPNLQQFADEGIVFEKAFSTAPLCTPARSSLFTGLSPHANGLMGLAHAGWRYRPGVRTLPELVSGAGYDTALIGLQHEDPDPLVLGFDHVGGVGFLPHADAVVDESVQWLADRNDSAPFLLAVGLWEVHRPWASADYPAVDPSTVEVPDYLPDTAESREDIAAMYGSIAFMDHHVGRLLQALAQHPDAENTLVIFTTDHGAAFPGAKGTLYDPGVEVAFIVRPPAPWGASPRRVSAQVSHLDIVPTVLELAGEELPDELEGESLLPHLQPNNVPDAADERVADRLLFLEKTYHDGYDPIRAVRSARWKYIRNFGEGLPRLKLSLDLEQSMTRRGMGDEHLAARAERELYDLAADPAEKVNVAGESAARLVIDELDAALMQWMRSTDDPLLRGPISPPPRPVRHDDGGETPARRETAR
ncbi:sulfatase family protein [Microbacterium sp. YY-01]|uniref:sulfatase family protein n=1 Tax=Microbacterium sp. YY-01 TaxID=3421634 RepID=UPI003D174851